jgi:hypothetical protein
MPNIIAAVRNKVVKQVQGIPRKLRWAWQNRTNARRIAREVAGSGEPIADLTRYERKLNSQHGEDGIIEAIFARIGVTNKYVVEFGVGSGRECNSAYLARKKGWTGLWMDGKQPRRKRALEVRQEFITAENILELFEKHGVPKKFDLLSIDIDGNDYWIWKKITGYQPRVVIMEYNASVPPTEARTIRYDPKFVWSKTDYYGASLLALARLGEEKGFRLVGCDNSGVNAFFVERSLADKNFARQSVEKLYRPRHREYVKDGREMVKL